MSPHFKFFLACVAVALLVAWLLVVIHSGERRP